MKKTETVEQLLSELDEMVRALSDETTSLEDALKLYAQAV